MAGTVKAQVQLGDSSTATQNFVLTSEAADGTMKLARGNKGATTQDILTVDASGKVAFPQNVQTLQDFTASGRVAGTTYTNNTGQPITIMVSMASTTAVAIYATMNGRTMYGSVSPTIGTAASITIVVPNGMSYSITMQTGTPTILSWVELR